ncbi:hypothetical protein [Burkholderia gladioli]|uniref:hypothetical protein n=1 Tax=Burkholderia gladioli TaxID=28095 RepID=UPI000F80E5FA|nr:hypothetical protein [Burkholderia gladioli]MBU9643725.1 hypothetical protein [Burkholderia gladioli]
MQTTIDRIREANRAAMLAIAEASRQFGDEAEFGVLLRRLQDAGTTLREAENQALRIKSRADFAAGY